MPIGFESMLTLTQALQLVGLVPCIFIVVFLFSLSFKNSQAVIPIFYFISLACAFALQLVDMVPLWSKDSWIEGSLLLGESMLTAFTFLLICQFLVGRIPSMGYWLVLAIPLIGGSSLIYASLLQGGGGDNCAQDPTCLDLDTIKTLYNIFSSSLIFLLLIYYSSRAAGLHESDIQKQHKYWLIIALILLHLLVLAVDLARISGHLTAADALHAETVFRLAFIYLVLTSIFRVFYPTLVSQVVQMVIHKSPYNPDADVPYVTKTRQLLENDHIYRQSGLNRARLAQAVGIGEYQLSRMINHHFSKSFHELINGYRIEEAKQRLRNEDTQITTIGFEVGFNSIASFNRVFRNKVGMSPSEYRSGGPSAAPVTESAPQ